MTGHAIISGTFADLKTVKTRGVVQLVIEVPIERAASVVEAFGFPQPGAEIPVAVARLVAAPEPQRDGQNDHTPEPPASAEPSQTTNANRAGMMIREPLFWQWVSGHGAYHGPVVTCIEAANAALLSICQTNRKRELDRDMDAAVRFERLRRDYFSWTQEPVG